MSALTQHEVLLCFTACRLGRRASDYKKVAGTVLDPPLETREVARVKVRDAGESDRHLCTSYC